MPKIGGSNIEDCMEICMSDEKTKDEYPDDEKRQEVCYAACSDNFTAYKNKSYKEYKLEKIVDKYKNLGDNNVG